MSIGIRQIAFLLVPASVAAAVLAEPIVRLLYERGEFTPDQTPVVAAALAAFTTGLAFNGMMLMLNRAFFALQSPWIPTWVAAFNLTLNTLLYIPLYRVGTWGIPLAISLSNVAAALVLLVLLRRRLGRLEIRETTRAIALITLASCALAGVSYGVWWALDEGLGDTFWAQVVAVGLALAAGAVAYRRRLLGAARSRVEGGASVDSRPQRLTRGLGETAAVPPERTGSPRCGVLSRPRTFSTRAPCVLAARRPERPGDEYRSAKPS